MWLFRAESSGIAADYSHPYMEVMQYSITGLMIEEPTDTALRIIKGVLEQDAPQEALQGNLLRGIRT